MRLSNPVSLLLVAAISLVTTAPTKRHDQENFLDANTYLAIDKVLNSFSFAVDERPVPTFDSIFAPNAYMNLLLPNSPDIGIASINNALIPLLSVFKTQHTFGTKSIILNADGTATCQTEFIGTFWGLGNKSHDWLQNYPMYYDTLTKIDGQWKITNKTLRYMTPSLGNLTLT